jgi:hypothetical protein
MYKIELLCTNNRWERSWYFAKEYTLAEAIAILLRPCCNMDYQFRMVNLNPKPYRRHAAITPLELRGAIAMLESSIEHIVHNAKVDKLACTDADYYNPFMILMNAKLACKRHLETL